MPLRRKPNPLSRLRSRILHSALPPMTFGVLLLAPAALAQLPQQPPPRPPSPPESVRLGQPAPTQQPVTPGPGAGPPSATIVPTTPGGTASASDSLGSIEADGPTDVELGEPFKMYIFLKSRRPDLRDSVNVYFELTPKVSYDPEVLRLIPGQPQVVRVRVNRSNSGLARLWAFAPNWRSLDMTLGCGVKPEVKVSGLDSALRSGATCPFQVSLVDREGSPVAVEAPVLLEIRASGCQLRQAGDPKWHEGLQVWMAQGSEGTPPLELRPRQWTDAESRLNVKIMRSDVLALRTVDKPFRVRSKWWLPLLLASVGGLLSAIFHVLQAGPSARGRWRIRIHSLVLSLGIGGLGYLVADKGLMGVSVGRGDLRGYLLLGFLCGYVGLDALMKLLIPAQDGTASPKQS